MTCSGGLKQLIRFCFAAIKPSFRPGSLFVNNRHEKPGNSIDDSQNSEDRHYPPVPRSITFPEHRLAFSYF
jgi:hypothetical protein